MSCGDIYVLPRTNDLKQWLGGCRSLVEVCLEHAALRVGNLHSKLPEAQAHGLTDRALGAVPARSGTWHDRGLPTHKINAINESTNSHILLSTWDV